MKKTPDARRQTPEAGRQTPDARGQTPAPESADPNPKNIIVRNAQGKTRRARKSELAWYAQRGWDPTPFPVGGADHPRPAATP